MPDNFETRHKVLGDNYYTILLHDHPELLDDCCKLINLEWKRSHTARLRSISGSSCNFPTSIVLMKESGPIKIIGHCKLSKISKCSPVAFVDTVVIHPDFRGKGLGKLLMKKAELYLKSKDIEWIYLTTMGQEKFYEKLGYSFCEPINIYGGQLRDIFGSKNESDRNFESLNQVTSQGNEISAEKTQISTKSSELVHSDNSSLVPSTISTIPTPPPPHPLPPPMPSANSKEIHIISKKTFMRKQLVGAVEWRQHNCH